MAGRRTTRCCSALALVAALAAAAPASAERNSDQGPPLFWPVQPVWTLALNNELTDTPAFDDTHAFFPIEGNRIVAYEIASGARTWIIEARPMRAPVAGGGFVFFAEDDAMVAVRSSDGSRAWSTPLDDGLAAVPVWTSGWLMMALRSGTIVAMRADDGHEIWRRDVGVAVHAPPAISGSRVYLPLDDSRVVALQIETGAPAWERKLGGPPGAILALDDRLFVGAADNYFYALMTETGVVDWRWRIGALATGLPAVDERRVYFVSLDNVVRALNRSNGVQQWMQLLKLRPIGGPLRAGGTVIVYGPQGPLRAFNASDGKGGGDIPASGNIPVPPHLIGADDPTPQLIVVTRDVSKGDSVTLMTHSADPQATPLAALPNPVTAVPTLATR